MLNDDFTTKSKILVNDGSIARCMSIFDKYTHYECYYVNMIDTGLN